jgi:hypothetical protein
MSQSLQSPYGPPVCRVSNGQPMPGQTLAVLLGASMYRYAPKLARGPAFYNSSQQFGQYLLDKMSVPEENVASFFDEGRSAGDQLRDIRDFLEHRSSELKNAGTPARNLIVHYVGHGLFSGGENDYCLAIRATDEQNEGFTSVRMRDLAEVIRNSAAFIRKYLILDCCFSGAAYAQFQSGPLAVAQVKVREVLHDESPQRGTSLLCSASAKDPSVAPRGLPRTMFSDSLLTVLTQGHESFGPWLSFAELGELVRIRIKETYRDLGVRPEVHSPDQGSGDVARVPLFPNPAWAKLTAEKPEAERLTQQRIEAERQARAQADAEPIAREKAESERLTQQRIEAERQAKAQADAERIAREKAEAERLTQQRIEAERQAKAQADAERVSDDDISWPKRIGMCALGLFMGCVVGSVIASQIAGSPGDTGAITFTNAVFALFSGVAGYAISSAIKFPWLPVLCAAGFMIAYMISRQGSNDYQAPVWQMLMHVAIALSLSFGLVRLRSKAN